MFLLWTLLSKDGIKRTDKNDAFLRRPLQIDILKELVSFRRTWIFNIWPTQDNHEIFNIATKTMLSMRITQTWHQVHMYTHDIDWPAAQEYSRLRYSFVILLVRHCEFRIIFNTSSWKSCHFYLPLAEESSLTSACPTSAPS